MEFLAKGTSDTHADAAGVHEEEGGFEDHIHHEDVHLKLTKVSRESSSTQLGRGGEICLT
jgi:hypothetical protein